MLGNLRRKLLRPVIIVPVVVAAGAGAWMGTHSSGKSSTPAALDRTFPVTAGTMRQTVTAAGTLEPADTENLNFPVSGQVTAVNVKAGQQVTKGTVLATIDSAALASQVQQAQATVASDSAKLAADQTAGATTAQINADQANLTAAQSNLASAQAALADASLVAPIDGTIASVNLTVGQQLGSSGASGTNLSGSGTGSGRTNASSSSSANGASASAASSSSSSSPQVQLISTGSYVVNLSVDDTEIGRLAVGQQATITPSTSAGGGAGGGGAAARFRGGFGGAGGGGFAGAAGGGGAGGSAGAGGTTATTTPNDSGLAAPTSTATGSVTSVGAIATSSSGVSSFPVVVTVTGNPTGFFAGASVNVAVTYNQLDNVLQVPAAAITTQNGQSFVTLLQGTSKVKTPVTTGLTSNGEVQVTNGLSEGDQVVVSIPTTTRTGSNSTNTNGNRTGTFFGGGGAGGAGAGAGGGFTRRNGGG